MSHGPSYLFLVGAPKCGTTSVAEWLGRLPGVVTPRIKEPCYFTDFGEHRWTGPRTEPLNDPAWLREWEAYDALFPAGEDVRWRVDASTDYLWCECAAHRIADFARGRPVKVAVILRDPVERAVSEHQHLLRDGYVQETLGEALAAEAERRARRMHPLFYHVTRSRYASAISRYHDLFGDDLLVLDYHRIREPSELARLARFIGSEPVADATLERRNAGFVYRSPGLRQVMKNPRNVRLARRLVPATFRAPIRRAVEGWAKRGYRPSQADIDALRARLADDIAACRADPRVPTENWTLAVAA